MTTDEAVEFVAGTIAEKNPDKYTPEQAREMVELARGSISVNPSKFVDSFLDGLAYLEKTHV